MNRVQTTGSGVTSFHISISGAKTFSELLIQLRAGDASRNESSFSKGGALDVEFRRRDIKEGYAVIQWKGATFKAVAFANGSFRNTISKTKNFKLRLLTTAKDVSLAFNLLENNVSEV